MARYGILDSGSEPEFDRIVRLARQLYAADVALITIFDHDRLWFKAQSGLDLAEVPIEQGLWHEDLGRGQPFWTGDVTADPRLCDNVFVQAPWNLRFHAGAPLKAPDGVVLGTVCVLDRAARGAPGPGDLTGLVDLADLVMDALERRRRAAADRVSAERAILRAELAARAAEAADFDTAVRDTMAVICAAMGGMAALVWHQAPGLDQVVPVGGHCTDRLAWDDYVGPMLRRPIPMVGSRVGEVLTTGRTVVVGDRANGIASHGMPAALQALGISAMIATPLSLGDERFALTLALGPEQHDLAALADSLAAAAESLRPLLRRQRDGFEAAQLRRVVEASEDAVMITGPVTMAGEASVIEYVNPAFERQSGYTAAEVIGQSAGMFNAPDVDPEQVARLRAAMARGQTARGELKLVTKSGEPRWAEMTVAPVADPSGWIGRWVVIARDVSERRREAERLAASEEAFRNLFELNPIPMFLFDPADLRILQVNDAASRSYGWSRATFLSMTMDDLRPVEDEWRGSSAWHSALEGQVTGPWQHRDAFGRSRQVELVSTHFGAGDHRQVLIAVWDVTEQIEAEKERSDALEALETQTAQLRHAQDLAKLGTWYCTGATGEVHWSPELFRILGIDATARNASEISVMGLVHPEDRETMAAAFVRTLQTGKPMELDIRGLRRDGSIAHLRVGGTRRFRKDGVPLIDGYCQDVTERREAEATMLRSEKLRTVGQLTGGIAHDFNNLLTVISGNLELARQELADGRDGEALIAAAQAASDRGAALTGQLLSYAGRKPMSVAPIELASFIPGLMDLVGRTLGEQHPLRLVIDGLVPQVVADRAQLETALVNLLLNARDANAAGGEIDIVLGQANVAARQIDDLAAGTYGVIAVTDRGIGMRDEVRARVFEPFFTTKPAGQGTGLGLCMVLGFARSSGGAVTIDSVAGRGTTVRLYLPLARPAGTGAVSRTLVVADQASARVNLLALCQEAGLEPFDVDSPAAAVRLIDAGTLPDLVLCDLTEAVPESETARLLARLAPGVPALALRNLGAAPQFVSLRSTELVSAGVAEVLTRLTEVALNLRAPRRRPAAPGIDDGSAAQGQ